MDKELPWWNSTINCMAELKKTIAAADAKRKEFITLLESGGSSLVKDLVRIFEQNEFEKKTNALKFLEGLSVKDLHILKAQVENLETTGNDMAKRNVATEIQDLIYGAIIMESQGALLPESSYGQ